MKIITIFSARLYDSLVQESEVAGERESGGRIVTMLIAHKIALDPNNAQRTYLARAVGTACFAYHWALDEWSRQYAAWKADNRLPKPNQIALRQQLNTLKRERFPWMREVTKCAPQLVITLFLFEQV